MSQDIPFATPFPWEWDSASMADAQKRATDSLRKRRFVGSGLAALRKNAFGANSDMSDSAKNILQSLMQQHNIKVGSEEGDFETEADELYGTSLSYKRSKDANVHGTADEEVLQLARDGRLSMFTSILHIIEEADSPVTTKNLIRNCSLTLLPGDVPGSIDAKEFLLSALHFLSSNFDAGSDQFLPMPLIRPVQTVGDLEKRSYEKAGEWKLVSAKDKDKILHLEHIFMTSPSDWKWVRRENFCPRLSQKDETSFFLKGSIPASASAKKTKGEGTRKRKASSPVPTATSSVNDEVVNDEVVEAVILADASPSNSVA